MPRNLDRKREYDRIRYAKKRKENLAAVREAERTRKAKAREKTRHQGDYGSVSRPYSIDDPRGAHAADRQAYKDWVRSEVN